MVLYGPAWSLPNHRKKIHSITIFEILHTFHRYGHQYLTYLPWTFLANLFFEKSKAKKYPSNVRPYWVMPPAISQTGHHLTMSWHLVILGTWSYLALGHTWHLVHLALGNTWHTVHLALSPLGIRYLDTRSLGTQSTWHTVPTEAKGDQLVSHNSFEYEL